MGGLNGTTARIACGKKKEPIADLAKDLSGRREKVPAEKEKRED